MTPQQNLEEAGRLLDEATSQLAADTKSSGFAAVEDVTALANSRISLAIAQNMVPLAGEFYEDYRDLRGPGKIA